MDDSPQAAPLSERYAAAIAVLLQRSDLRCLLTAESAWRVGPNIDNDHAAPEMLAYLRSLELGDSEAEQAVAALVAVYEFLRHAEHRAAHDDERLRMAEVEALVDSLTGVPNRRAWDRAIAREEARDARHGVGVAIAVVDVDDLKAVNDGHGHLAGDLMLRQVAQLLREVSREADVVARIGGDEFGVLAVDCEVGGADALAERLQAELDAAGLAASVGAAANTSTTSLTEVFAMADRAMYEHKRQRKQRTR